MNEALVEKVVRAVLYEGYILYPYRPSVKNHQRWTFGGIYPQAFSESQHGSDAWFIQTQCLITGTRRTAFRVNSRFLHLTARTVERARPGQAGEELAFEPVESLEIDGQLFQTWQEAVERDIGPAEVELGDLALLRRHDFAFPHCRESELLRDAEGRTAGRLVREQQAVDGTVELSAELKAPGVFALTVRTLNRTPFEAGGGRGRDAALLRAFVSAHTVLAARGGGFVSPTDPPEPLCDLAAGCENVGCWPVLVGEPGDTDTLLASPIILSDYPQVAPESPGDLFDATEIDEILTLRVMTLTEEEKRQAAAVDGRAREMLARTESLAREQLMKLHGRMTRQT